MRRFERLISKIAVENFTVYVIALTGLVSGLALYTNSNLGLLTFESLFVQGEFWHLLIFPFRVDAGSLFQNAWLGLLLFLFIFWQFASWLEAELGTVRFNTFIYLGWLILLVGGVLETLVVGQAFVSAFYLDFAVLIAVAYLNPNQQILLFFFLPVKLKWIAWIFLVIMIYGTIRLVGITGDFFLLLTPVFGLGNFLLFYGPDMFARVGRRGAAQVRRAKFEMAMPTSIHRCAVCGLTEHDDPQMDFRYCVDCDDHEYCAKHLHDHRHVNVTS